MYLEANVNITVEINMKFYQQYFLNDLYQP